MDRNQPTDAMQFLLKPDVTEVDDSIALLVEHEQINVTLPPAEPERNSEGGSWI